MGAAMGLLQALVRSRGGDGEIAASSRTTITVAVMFSSCLEIPDAESCQQDHAGRRAGHKPGPRTPNMSLASPYLQRLLAPPSTISASESPMHSGLNGRSITSTTETSPMGNP